MRALVLSILALALTACVSLEREPVRSVEIKQITPRYMETAQFVRIGEYLSARENTGDRLILRSRPEIRDGLYFVLVLDQPVRRLPRGTRVRAEVIGGESPGPVEYAFELPARRPRTKEIFVGLTGPDWPQPEAVPSAWRFTLSDANGKTLGSRESFLWTP